MRRPSVTSPKALSQGEKLDGEYELPFLAHAPMEPMNCTVRLTPGACEIWTGTQVMARVQAAAAKSAGVPVDKVTVHNHLLGGGFGRRLETDMVESAVRIAKHVDAPIKVVWTREEDIRHDIYRPVYRDVISATLSGRENPRLEVSGDRFVDHGPLVSRGLSERRRYRCGR